MLRTAVLGAVALLATALLGAWSAELATRGVVRVDDAVALGAAAGGTLVAAWYALSATALLLAQLAELSRRAPRLARRLRAAVGVAGAPVLRRAAVLGVGAGLALAAVPASAGPATDDGVPHDLRPGVGALSGPGLAPTGKAPTAEEPEAAAEPAATDNPPLREPSVPPSTPEPPAPRRTPAPAEDRRVTAAPTVEAVADSGVRAADRPRGAAPSAAAADTEAHVVRPGDSLWSIARAHLGEGASDAEVAAEWPRWHSTNRAVIGANPHLIHPGQTLLAPDTEEQR